LSLSIVFPGAVINKGFLNARDPPPFGYRHFGQMIYVGTQPAYRPLPMNPRLALHPLFY
jgi:hypothetical protein